MGSEWERSGKTVVDVGVDPNDAVGRCGSRDLEGAVLEEPQKGRRFKMFRGRGLSAGRRKADRGAR